MLLGLDVVGSEGLIEVIEARVCCTLRYFMKSLLGILYFSCLEWYVGFLYLGYSPLWWHLLLSKKRVTYLCIEFLEITEERSSQLPLRVC